jgi:hypothetical protein
MRSLANKFKQHLKTQRPASISGVLQTWWVVEKRVEGPESDRMFSAVVGVLKEQEKNLKRPYIQTAVMVMTDSIQSRSGVALDWRGSYPHRRVFTLSPIDYKYRLFGGWD